MRRVLAFYKFVPLTDPSATCEELLELGTALDIKGTILLAEEGVNGTIVGSESALKHMAQHLEQRCGPIPFKWSELNEDNLGFYRFKVKVKPEIVSFGVAGLDIANNGEHVDADTWDKLLADPDVVVIDTRNQYEVDIGTFPGSVSPQTTNFREFPDWVADNLDPAEHPKIAMFCTGGIRCEKASAYMLAQGFESVYQLDGGILKYMETTPPDSSRWEGECFVFDQRVSVTSDLKQGHYEQCFACRHPLSQADMENPVYEYGVRCPHCAATVDATRAANLRERRRQVALSEQRGEQHIGKRQSN